MSDQQVPACPYCMKPAHPTATVCNGCGAVKSTWALQAFPAAPLFYLGTLAAYLFFGPYAIYYAAFRANSDPYRHEPTMLFLAVGIGVTVLGALLIRWLTLTLSRERWFRRT